MILLLGASGYVGSAFKKYLRQHGLRFVAASVRYPLDKEHFQKILIKNCVELVINCAGFVGSPNVDACEIVENKIKALEGNSFLPHSIVKVCKQYSIPVIHISSGCIFTDHNCDVAIPPARQFNEEDEANFCANNPKYSWYSATKALGEQLLAPEKESHTIYRLRIPFNGDVNPRNYISKILKYNVLLNATNSLTQLDEFVHVVMTLKHQGQVFNVTQPGYVTTHQVVTMMKKRGMINEKIWFRNIEDFESTVAAPRSNCVLDCSKVTTLSMKNSVVLTPIEEALELAIDKYAFNLKNG